VPASSASLAINTAGAASAVLPATQTITGTTETVILNPALNSATAPLVLSVPANSPLEGKMFDVVASGLLNNGTSSTVTIKLYSGKSTTVGSDTLLGSSGAISAFAGKSPWSIMASRVQFDSSSGKMQGQIGFLVNNSLVAVAAFSNVVTGISNTSATGDPTLNFVISVTFGSAGTQVVTVYEFAVNF